VEAKEGASFAEAGEEAEAESAEANGDAE